jgi:hypothetical protein
VAFTGDGGSSGVGGGGGGGAGSSGGRRAAVPPDDRSAAARRCRAGDGDRRFRGDAGAGRLFASESGSDGASDELRDERRLDAAERLDAADQSGTSDAKRAALDPKGARGRSAGAGSALSDRSRDAAASSLRLVAASVAQASLSVAGFSERHRSWARALRNCCSSRFVRQGCGGRPERLSGHWRAIGAARARERGADANWQLFATELFLPFKMTSRMFLNLQKCRRRQTRARDDQRPRSTCG